MSQHKTKKKKVEDDLMDVDESPNDRPSTSRQNQENIINGDIEEPLSDEENGFRIGDIYIPPAPKPALTFDTTGPRLIISHIINENFKSYAGVEILGPFHKSFTAIVGPNGSGKSNVIDSMLFVFGYRATKIRSKKISVLIHSSSKFPNVKSATVSVHFYKIIDGEGENFTIVPDSEIVVSRTAFRDSSSFYTLNGRRVQFKQVARMLRDNGIDLDHNRFLILQGEVEQIAMMKPKAVNEHDTGMLEYLEDIIGTSRYKEPIEKLYLKVDELTEQRKDKLNRVRLVEQDKAKLEQPMKEAVDLMNLTNTAIRTRNTLLQKYIQASQKIIEEKEQDLEDLKVNLSAIDEKLRILQNDLKEKTDVLKDSTRQYDILRKKKEDIGEKLQGSKRKVVTTQADLLQNKKKKTNLDQLIGQEKARLIELEVTPEKNEREIQECESLLIRYTEQKDTADEELQTTVANVRAKTRGLQENKDEVQARLIDLKRIVDDANRCHKLAEAELRLYLSNQVKETEKLEKMKEDYEQAKVDLETKKPMQQELERNVSADVAKLNELHQKLRTAKHDEMKILNEIRPMRTQLEESRQLFNADQTRDRVLIALMNESEQGRISGIFGRLGALGGIDSKYDVAISTCCTGLDSIVVDNVDTAQICVQFLKDNEIGRGTFIALDKQDHLIETYQERKTFPENAIRLFDLIEVSDERVLPAFYYALRDTLVAKDLEQASRIAYGRRRYRVVTLNGDVIETSGTMSGGGTRPKQGKMGRSVQQNTNGADLRRIKEKEEKLAILERRLSINRREQSEFEEAVAILPGTIRNGKIMLNKLNIEIKNWIEKIPMMEDQIAEQEARVEESRVDPEEKARLEAAVATTLEALIKAKEDAGKVEQEVKKIDAQIAAVAGNKVKELQKAVNDVSNKIDKVNSEITKLKVAINTSKRNAKKSKDKLQQMEADLLETERNTEMLNNQKKEAVLECSRLERELEELDEQISEGSGEFKGVKQQIATLQSIENKIKAERLGVNNDVIKIEKAIQECRGKKPVWERELQHLKLEEPGIEGVPGMEAIPPLAQHTEEELEELEVEELRHRLTVQKNRIGDRKPNIQAIKDYKSAEEMYLQRAAELDEITSRRNEVREVYDTLKKKRTTDFLTGFNTITAKLKEMYQMITLGGDAELELVDSLDPFTEGIIFSVRPPNKSWKNISNLSGGEKTLSSLSLVFALHYYKPTPLYVMDEIDAALDFKNVSIVANYIKERTKNAQFIIISLRYNMFEVCNRLIGIYKTEDCTKSVTIENKLPPPLPFDDPVININAV